MPPKRKNIELDQEEINSGRATRARTRSATTNAIASISKDKPATKLGKGASSGSGDKNSSKIKKTDPEAVNQSTAPVAVNGGDSESTNKEKKPRQSSSTKNGPSKSSKSKLPLPGSPGSDDDNNASQPTKRGSTSKLQKTEFEGSAVTKKAPATTKALPKPDDLSPSSFSESSLLAFFSKYADEEALLDGQPQTLSPEGIMSLCEDAGISLEGVQPILLAWICNAKRMANIDRDEWISGLGPMKIDTVSKLALALSEMEDQLYAKSQPAILSESTKDPYRRTKLREIGMDRDKSLKDLYLFAFDLAKVGTARNIDIDTAIAFWGVILKPKYPQIADFIAYIEEMNADENSKMYKGVTKDLWKMTLQFLKTVQADLSNYDPEAGWPTTLDAYAAWKTKSIDDS